MAAIGPEETNFEIKNQSSNVFSNLKLKYRHLLVGRWIDANMHGMTRGTGNSIMPNDPLVGSFFFLLIPGERLLVCRAA